MVAILHPTGPGSQIPIDRAVVLIGRSPDCDAVLDVSSKISRLHCALVQVDAEYYIRDLGSMNGVVVAGQRVDREAKLRNGAEVLIGDVKFLFLENVMPAARPARPSGGKAPLVQNDETVEVLDAVEIISSTPPPHTSQKSPMPVKARQSGVSAADFGERMPKLRLEESGEFVDAEVIEDVEVIDSGEDETEVVEVVDVIGGAEVIEIVDVIEDVEVIDDVEIIDDPGRKSGPRPRRR